MVQNVGKKVEAYGPENTVLKKYTYKEPNKSDVPDKGQKSSESLQDVGIRGSRFAYGGAQLSVAQGSKHREDPSDGPHHQREAKGTRVVQHPLKDEPRKTPLAGL